MLGIQHAMAILEVGGSVVITDLDFDSYTVHQLLFAAHLTKRK